MKRLLVAIAIFSVTALAIAQDEDPQVKAERARLAAERNQAEAVYRGEEKACYGKFAVTDCLKAAKAKRRAVLADLHRQEISLNDTQRKRQAAEHLRELEERSSAKRQQERADRQAKALADQKARDERAAAKAASRASSAGSAASAASNAAARENKVQRKQAEAATSRTRRDQEAADNLKQFEQRQAEAKQHKADMAKRAAERTKPPASSLAVPP